MTYPDPLASVRGRLTAVTESWAAGLTLAEIRSSFELFMQDAGPQAHARALAGWSPVEIGGLKGARFGTGLRHALYCHGGGFQIGSVHSHASLIQRIAEASNLAVLGFNYRLAPEHRFPAAADDAFEAFRWMTRQAGPPVAIIGDSAGGNLALQVALRARDEGLPKPKAVVLLSPWLDLEMRAPSYDTLAVTDVFSTPAQLAAMARTYIGRANDPANPAVSPINADLRALPPLLIHAGAHDITVGDSLILSERLTAANVDHSLQVFAGMCHHFQIFEQLAESKSSIAQIGQFLRGLPSSSDRGSGAGVGDPLGADAQPASSSTGSA